MRYHVTTLGKLFYMHVPLSTKQYELVPASAGTLCTTGAVLVGWQPIGRRCSWWPTSLIPVVAVVFICGLSDVLINEYLFIYLVAQLRVRMLINGLGLRGQAQGKSPLLGGSG